MYNYFSDCDLDLTYFIFFRQKKSICTSLSKGVQMLNVSCGNEAAF